jgi:hypothetical protein
MMRAEAAPMAPASWVSTWCTNSASAKSGCSGQRTPLRWA